MRGQGSVKNVQTHEFHNLMALLLVTVGEHVAQRNNFARFCELFDKNSCTDLEPETAGECLGLFLRLTLTQK